MKKKMGFAIGLFVFVSIASVFADGNASIIRQLIQQCEQSLGVSIRINQSNDYRSPRRQAELMANMSNSQLESLYGGSYVSEMTNIPRNDPQRVSKFETIIKRVLGDGSDRYISRHLTGDAVDIAPSTTSVKNWFMGNGVSVKDETVDGIRCWHLELN
jgi:hypothetical protein